MTINPLLHKFYKCRIFYFLVTIPHTNNRNGSIPIKKVNAFSYGSPLYSVPLMGRYAPEGTGIQKFKNCRNNSLRQLQFKTKY